MPRRRALPLAATPLILLLAVPAMAAPPSPPVRYRAHLEVDGIVEVVRRHDDTGECRPGRRWTMTDRGTVSLHRPVRVTTVGSVVVVGAVRGGEASHETTVSGYAETNHCAPTPPAPLEPPRCAPAQGGRAFATLGSTAARRHSLLLGVTRLGGPDGDVDGECRAPALDTVDPAAQVSPLQRGLRLPLDLRGRSVATLGRGKRVFRRLRISGPCDAVRVTHGKRPPLATGDCVVDGTVEVELVRRR